VLVRVLVLVWALVLVLVIGSERVLVRVTRFRTRRVAIAPPDESCQKSVKPACGGPCCTSSEGVAISRRDRDVNGRGRFARFPTSNRVDAPPVGVARTANGFRDIQAYALRGAGHLIAQLEIHNP
jgi:hypothetical protein